MECQLQLKLVNALSVLLTRLFINLNIDPVIVIGAVNLCKNCPFYRGYWSFRSTSQCGKVVESTPKKRITFRTAGFPIFPLFFAIQSGGKVENYISNTCKQ